MSQDLRRERAGIKHPADTDRVAELEAKLYGIEGYIELLESDRYGPGKSPLQIVEELRYAMEHPYGDH